MRDIEAHELDRLWSTAELESLPRGSTMWNPFAVLIMAGSERAEKLGRQWQQFHDGYQNGPAPNVDHSDDPLANILADASLKRAGVRVVKGEDGATAVFPARQSTYTRQEEDDWELRAKTMHANQGTLEVPGFEERAMEGPGRVSRPSFHSLMSDPVNDVPKYEDLTPEERKKLGH